MPPSKLSKELATHPLTELPADSAPGGIHQRKRRREVEEDGASVARKAPRIAADSPNDYNSRVLSIFLPFFDKTRPKLIEGTGYTPHIIDLKPYQLVLPKLYEIGETMTACNEILVSCQKSGFFSETSELMLIKAERARAQEITEAIRESCAAIKSGDYASIPNSIEVAEKPSQLARLLRNATFTTRSSAEQTDIKHKWLTELAMEAQEIHSRPSRWICRFYGIDIEVEGKDASKCGCKGDKMCELAESILTAKGRPRKLGGLS